jgi:hypothetical protein
MERCLQPSSGHERSTTPYERQEELMNRKLGQLIKAALFALPFALPGVALAQSATGSSGSPSGAATDTANPAAQDTNTPGSLDKSDNVGNSNAQGSSGMNAPSGTLDQNNKNQPNAGSLGNQPTTPGTNDYNPPEGALDNSGSSTATDKSVGGDINKSDDTSNMNTESTGTMKHKKTKKTIKHSTTSDTTSSDTGSSDMNK